MNKYILYCEKTNELQSFPSFKEAEKELINSCKKPGTNCTDYLIGNFTHSGISIGNHTELVVIDQASKASGYIPQEGDEFVKVKRNIKPKEFTTYFERRIIKVNPDTVVIVNKNDVDNPQVMPISQWMRWIRGADFIKKAGEDV